MTYPEHSDPTGPSALRASRRLADTPIAIVGMGGLFPQAPSARDYWQNIVDGADCTRDVPADRWNVDDHFDPDPTAADKSYSRRGGFVPDVDFDPLEFGLPPNQLEVTSTLQTLSLGVARDTLADAGAPGSDWYDPSRTGVVLGVTGPVPLMHPLAARLSTPVLEEVVRSCGLTASDGRAIAEKYAQAFAPWVENSFPGLLANVVAGRIANRFGLGGMNSTVDAACAASLSAVRVAIAELTDGRADLMLTGGADTENSIFVYLCFSKVGALSHADEIRPFDASADGTLIGEGIGMLALKRLADARRDGDRVYAVIDGLGSSSDGRSKSIYAPRAEGQRLALDRAYDDAQVSPAAIELFEAHATGTAVGDRTELTALGGLLTEHTDEVRFAGIGSVKSQIGHTKGAAGTASLMKLAYGLYHKTLPPTINVDVPNELLTGSAAPLYANTRTRPWILDPARPRRRAAASAMGFGGTNFHVVLSEASGERGPVLHRTARAHLWHAPDVEGLRAALAADGPAPEVEPVPAGHARVGFAAASDDEADELRALALAELTSAPEAEEWSHPRGVWFRRRELADLRVGAVFAGQGSQYLDMGLEAVVNNPVVAGAFDEANAAFAGADRRLGGIVFPPPVFDADLRHEQEAALRATAHAQPAIGALAAGQFRFLRDRGLECSALLGHSFGELTALWAAGSLTDDAFFALARARGLAMAPAEGSTDDPGAMAAVSAARERVEEMLDGTGVVVCNHNAPDQVVVGGGTEAVGRFVDHCTEQGITARALPVAAAFHTDHVAHAVEDFRRAVDAVEIGAPRVPVVADSPGAVYSDDVAANREVLAGQLLQPVEFVAGLERLAEAACTVVVEFGPKQVLTQLVRRTLGDAVVAIPTDGGPLGDGDLTLKQAAVRLAVLGAPLSGIGRDDAPAAAPPLPGGMTVTLSGAEYIPPARAAAYEAGLADGRPLQALAAGGTPAPDPAPITGPPTAPAPAPAPAAGLSAAPATPAAAASSTAPATTAPATTVPAVPESTGTSALVRRESNGVVPTGSHSSHGSHGSHGSVPPPPDAYPDTTGPRGEDVLTQQTALHTRYLEGQLDVAQRLLAVGESATLDPAVATAVAAQSEAISRTHIRANEVLASLAALEQGHPAPAPPTTSDDRAPHARTTRPSDSDTLGRAPGPGRVAPPTAAGSVRDCATQSSDSGTSSAGTSSAGTSSPDASTGAGSTAGAPGPTSQAISGPVSELAAPVDAATVAAGLSTADHAAPSTDTVDAAALRQVLVEVVADKTGYPASMVDPGLDLEADLGVDSIKRVQVLGAVQERYPQLPAVGPESLAELRTLDQIVAHLATASPTTDPSTDPADPADPTTPAAAPAAVSSSDGVDAAALRQVLVEVVADKTGYPASMVDPGLDLEADLGVDSIKRVQVLGAVQERYPQLPAVGPESLAELRTLDQIVAHLATAPPTTDPSTDPTAPAPTATLGAGDDPARPDVAAVGAFDAAALRRVLVEVVADKTGYPASMVDPGLDLEADLGVDSIKRVQVLGAVQERYPQLPAIGPESLAELRTLDQIVGHLAPHAPAGSGTGGAPAVPPAPRQPDGDGAAVRPVRIVALPDRDEGDPEGPYAADPVAVLVDRGGPEPDALEVALGDAGWTVRRVVLPSTLGADWLTGADDDPSGLEAHLDGAFDGDAADGRVDVCLLHLRDEEDLASSVRQLADAVLVAGRAHDALVRTAGNGTRGAFVTVTRCDGALGLRGHLIAADSVLAGVGGLVKTVAREAPALFCRALDIAPDRSPEAAAAVVLAELSDAAHDVVEVGVDRDGLRWTTAVGEDPEPTGDATTGIGSDDVVVVTGGARGVTAHCVRALAERSGAEFVLLGRTALTDEPAWAQDVDDADLTAAAAAGLADGDRRPTPREVSAARDDVLAQREVRATLEAVRACGARADHVAVDVTDAGAVRAALTEVAHRATVVVHGAGALADATITAKTRAQVHRVLAPKLTGLHHVLDAMPDAPLHAVVLFGSVAGVHGNPGQADYALANEALARWATSTARTRPTWRIATLAWGAWDGGMVTPALREHFRDAGVPLIDLDEGARTFVERVGSSGWSVVGSPAPLGGPPPSTAGPVTVRRDLDALRDDPVLRAHQVGADVVLPATVALGWMVGATERTHPGRLVDEVRDLAVRSGVVFGPDRVEPLTLTVDGPDDTGAATVAVHGTGPAARYSATVRLTDPTADPAAAATPSRRDWPHDRLGQGPEDGLGLYRGVVFHGPELQGMRRVLEASDQRVVLECRLPDTPIVRGAFAGRRHDPARADVVLQAASVLGHRLLGGACLPLGVGRIELSAPIPEDFVLLVENPRPGPMTVRVDVTVCEPGGDVLQRWSDVDVFTTPGLDERFAQGVASWCSDGPVAGTPTVGEEAR